MSILPLAIYTATQGLSWNYPRGEIAFAELDACRKALCPLPDFDAGDPGYEGVWVTETRVFFLHCQSAPAWDFRGRNATYLAVTWVPRDEVGQIDIDALLNHPALCVPNRNPELFFDFAAIPQATRSLSLTSLPTTLPDGFRSVGAVIATLAPNQTARLRRKLTEQVVSCRYEVVSRVLQQDSASHLLPKESATPRKAPTVESAIAPAPMESEDVKLLKIALVLSLITLLCSLILNVWLGLPHLKRAWQNFTCDKKPTPESAASDMMNPTDEKVMVLEMGRNEMRTTVVVVAPKTEIEEVFEMEPAEETVDEILPESNNERSEP